MKICFSTWYRDFKLDAEQLVRSAKHFHPDIPFEVYDYSELERLNSVNPRVLQAGAFSYIGRELADKYDVVIHLDADCIIVDTLDEVLALDYDIACVRNNNDHGRAGKGVPFTRGNIGVFQYVNAGFHAITKKEVWEDWCKRNDDYGWNTPMIEQATLNDMFYSGKYKTKLLDPVESDLYYGLSNTGGTATDWDVWQNIYIENGKLKLNNKRIKIFHIAGGGLPAPGKLKFDVNSLFKPEIAEYVSAICQ